MGGSDPVGAMMAEHYVIKKFQEAKRFSKKHHRTAWTHLVDFRAAWWYSLTTLLCAVFTTSPTPDRAYDVAHLVFLVASALYVATIVFTSGELSRRGTKRNEGFASAVVIVLWFGMMGFGLVVFFAKDWYTPTPNDGEYFGFALALMFIAIAECMRREFYSKPVPVVTTAAPAPVATAEQA